MKDQRPLRRITTQTPGDVATRYWKLVLECGHVVTREGLPNVYGRERTRCRECPVRSAKAYSAVRQEEK